MPYFLCSFYILLLFTLAPTAGIEALVQFDKTRSRSPWESYAKWHAAQRKMEGFEEYLKTQLLFSNQLVVSVSKALLVNSPVSNMDCTSQERIANTAANNSKQSRNAEAKATKY